MTVSPVTFHLPTPDNTQHKLTDPQASVWVEASAGSGKTKALTDRVLALLVQGVAPDSILCLTFTKAAAAEMRQRIMDRLRSWSQLESAAVQDDLSRLLGRARDEIPASMLVLAPRLFDQVLDNPDAMAIETLHAFCARLLQRFPVEAGLAPFFSVLEPDEAPQFWHEALQELWTTVVGHDDPLRQALHILARYLTPAAFSALIDELRSAPEAAQLLRNPPSAAQLMQAMASVLQVDEQAAYHAQTPFDPQQVIQQFCQAVPDPHVQDLATHDASDKWAMLRAWSKAAAPERERLWNDYRQVFLTQAGNIRKNLTASVRKTPAWVMALDFEAQRVQDTHQTYQRLSVAQACWALNHVVHALWPHYERLKQRRGIVDHPDLIVRAHHVLTQADAADWILYKLDARIAHVLVDEAQDTSLEQWALLAALTDDFFAGASAHAVPRSLFVVGDRKQSIYGFQGADVAAFQAFKTHFAARAIHWHEVQLQDSFRSVPQILDYVDAIGRYAPVHTAWLGPHSEESSDRVSTGIMPPVQHVSRRADHPGCVEVWPLVTELQTDVDSSGLDGDEETPEGKARVHPRTVLAATLAGEIARWLATSRRLPSRPQGLSASDIMVLVRQRGPFVDELRQALIAHNVPVCDADRFKVSEPLCNRDLLALAQWLLLPEDDFSLAVLLKSPLFNLSEDDLYTLAYARESQSLWQRVQTLKPDSAATLQSWRERSLHIPPSQWFIEFLACGGRATFVGAQGPGCMEALDQWVAIVQRYEANHVPTLQGFVAWFQQREDVTIKRELADSTEQAGVRIMTVHGAKGLQAPVVILADTTQGFDKRSTCLFDMHQRLILWVPEASLEPEALDPLRQQDLARQFAEHQRLLYVAMTRAEDHLLVAGWKNRTRLPQNTWYQNFAAVLNTTEFLPHASTQLHLVAPPCLPSGFQWLSEDHKAAKTIYYGDPRLFDQDLNSADGDTAPAKMQHVSVHQDAINRPSFTCPIWLDERATWSERTLSSRTASTSEGVFENKESSAESLRQRQRGTHMHRLLELLPQTPRAAWPAVAAHAVGEQASALLPSVQRILDHPEWRWMFGESSQAEVPLTGLYQGQRVFACVDRLVRCADRWCVIDFKTGTPHDPVPAAYVEQMRIYQALLSPLSNPGAPRIEAWILWVDALQLVPVAL